MTDLSLTVNKRIPALPAQVYNAWLNPATMKRFMFGGSGMAVSDAATDPRIGGAYRVVMSEGTKDIPHHGTYLELVPHSRIAFTWQSPYSIDGSTVTLDFTPDGDSTMLTLTHVRFANEGARDGHKAGWTSILDTLATVLA